MKARKISGLCLCACLVAISMGLQERASGLYFVGNTEPCVIEIAQGSDVASLLEQGNSQFDTGDYGDAIQSYTDALEVSQSNAQITVQALLCRSRAYVFATVFGSPGYDNYDEAMAAAIADCSRVISLEPVNPAGYYCRGFAHFYEGSRQEAFTDFDRAIELAPNNSQAYYLRGYVYYLSNNNGMAIRDFSRVIELAPDFTSAYFFRGVIYQDLQPQDAIEDFNQAITLEPTNFRYYQARGNVRSSLGDYQGAVEDFTKVIELAPSGNAYAYSERGLSLAALGRYREAIADYDQAINLVPRYIMAHYGRGLARAELGDAEGALSDLQAVERYYREDMGEGNLDQPLYQQILQAIERLRQR